MQTRTEDSEQQERQEQREKLRRRKHMYLTIGGWSTSAAVLAAIGTSATIAHMGAVPAVTPGAWFVALIVTGVGLVVCLVSLALWASSCRQRSGIVAEQRAAKDRSVALEEWLSTELGRIGGQLTVLRSEARTAQRPAGLARVDARVTALITRTSTVERKVAEWADDFARSMVPGVVDLDTVRNMKAIDVRLHPSPDA